MTVFFFSDGGNVRCCGRSIVYVFVIISICMWMLRERNMGDKRNADGKFSFVLECWITNKLITNMHDAKKHICCGERSICRSIFFFTSTHAFGQTSVRMLDIRASNRKNNWLKHSMISSSEFLGDF